MLVRFWLGDDVVDVEGGCCEMERERELEGWKVFLVLHVKRYDLCSLCLFG